MAGAKGFAAAHKQDSINIAQEDVELVLTGTTSL